MKTVSSVPFSSLHFARNNVLGFQILAWIIGNIPSNTIHFLKQKKWVACSTANELHGIVVHQNQKKSSSQWVVEFFDPLRTIEIHAKGIKSLPHLIGLISGQLLLWTENGSQKVVARDRLAIKSSLVFPWREHDRNRTDKNYRSQRGSRCWRNGHRKLARGNSASQNNCSKW